MTRLASILFALVLSSEAFAANVTGNVLSGWCESSEAFESLRCFSYVVGVLDSAELSTNRYNFVERNWEEAGIEEPSHTNYLVHPCIPDGVTQGQVVKVVTKYMDEHPEDLHMNGSALVLNALHSTWTCAYLLEDAN